MKKTIRIWCFMIFLCLTYQAFSSNLIADLNTLHQNPAGLRDNMPLFIKTWGKTYKSMKKDSTHNEIQESAHSSLNNNLVPLLLTNYNTQGVQFFSRHGGVQSRLTLAHAYFRGNFLFTIHNQPGNTYAPMILSAYLFFEVFLEIRNLQDICMKEFRVACQMNQKVKDLNFSCLPLSQKNKIHKRLKALITAHKAPTLDYDELTLNQSTPEELFAIEQIIYFGADVSSPYNRICAAWCVYHILGEPTIAQNLYEREKKLSLLRGIQDIGSFEEWLSDAHPYMVISAQTA